MYRVSEEDLLQNGHTTINQAQTTHISSGHNICDFVIIHYTASHGSGLSSTAWAGHPESKVSWHITIDRNGSVIQLADFRKICWHAGESSWYAPNNGRDYKEMNKFSVGIELANAGILERDSNVFQTEYGAKIPSTNVLMGPEGNYWEQYSHRQITTAYDIALAISKKYNCLDILGHNQIAPARKIDPGPFFPLQDLRHKLREQDWYIHSKQL